MGLEFKGLDELNEKITKAVNQFPKKRTSILKQAAENVIRYTKEVTPVDTGHLRNGWSRTRPYGTRIKVYNNVEYALHVEWGHRQKKRWVPGYWSNGKFQYDSTAKTGMMLKEKVIEGAKMLHQGIEEAAANFEEDMKDALGDIFK